MPTTDSETTGTPPTSQTNPVSTISVATMSAIAIDLDSSAAVLPRQAEPQRAGFAVRKLN